MKYIKIILSLLVSLTILNVWLIRFDNDSIYRGGEAKNMIQEFEEYGLNESSVYIVGFFKVSSALFLLIGLYYNKLLFPSALTISLFMIAALIMHFKVSDELIKFIPSSILFFSSLVIIYLDRFIKT
tara:strand:- start:1158 stop:1538 length:381 start_codon:yes stop_codon:yes gene_type:complete